MVSTLTPLQRNAIENIARTIETMPFSGKWISSAADREDMENRHRSLEVWFQWDNRTLEKKPYSTFPRGGYAEEANIFNANGKLIQGVAYRCREFDLGRDCWIIAAEGETVKESLARMNNRLRDSVEYLALSEVSLDYIKTDLYAKSYDLYDFKKEVDKIVKEVAPKLAQGTDYFRPHQICPI